MSNEPMTEERLAEIRGREKAATQGPWVADEHAFSVTLGYNPDHKRTHGYGCGNNFVCDLNDGEYHEYYREAEQRANADFIAHAREDVSALLDEVERLRAEIARQENVIWFFSEAVKDFARYEVKLGTPKEYKTEIGGEYPSANRVETWKEPYWRKAADMATRESPGNSGDVPESEQEGKR